MPEIITIGETMATFAADTPGFLRYARGLEIHVAGAESNLAIGVSKLGHTAGWISALGEDEFGHLVRNAVRAEGVDASQVRFDSQHRTGVMFKQVQYGAETSVFYYRENSAASHMKAGILTPEYLKTAGILHLTGITPVLSQSCEQMIRGAIQLAKENHVLVSFDPNIRKKLWGEKDYTSLIRELMLEAEIVLLGKDEAFDLLGTDEEKEVFDALFGRGKAVYAALKDGARGAFAADQSGFIHIPPRPCRCVDPIGAGDAFNAAFLCGILENKEIRECGLMGAAAGALATETYGDIEGYPERKKMEASLKNLKEVYR